MDEVPGNALEFIKTMVIQIFAVLTERPLLTVALFGLMVTLICWVESAQRRIDETLDSEEDQ